jgi:hypothetical protein
MPLMFEICHKFDCPLSHEIFSQSVEMPVWFEVDSTDQVTCTYLRINETIIQNQISTAE